uniref:Leucine-rich repeat and WD repeat-containing protein 1 WD domain-containing protein n=1 Tax=Clastoptera arizonana TaxID=38151 RepID=A0A1B6DMD0_9HEMI
MKTKDRAKKAKILQKYSDDLDFDPVHFLRCHSKKSDYADVQTQVWQCAFEPDTDNLGQTTSLIATCGGNSICFINVESGEVISKYYAKDLREMFYTLAWTSVAQMTVLATAGVRNTIHLIHPAANVVFLQHLLKENRNKSHINFLLFHPISKNILFCGSSNGEILVFDIGEPMPPSYQCDFKYLFQLSANSEVFGLSFCSVSHVLLAACNNGLKGWNFQSVLEFNKDNVPELMSFSLPTKDDREQDITNQDLVDSVEVLGDGTVATKCALHGAIYLWSLSDTLENNSLVVKPTHVLRWSNTDNYFMVLGAHRDAGLLCCGDDGGALWLYDISKMPEGSIEKPCCVEPTIVISWPNVTDQFSDKKRKLNLDVYDIVVDKVAVSSSGKYIVAVTNNNMVCIWKQSKY